MKHIIQSTETVAKFFKVKNDDIVYTIWNGKWSHAIVDHNSMIDPDDESVFLLNGVGAYLPVTSLHDVEHSKRYRFMNQVQDICKEGDILEAIATQIITEYDRQNLIKLIDIIQPYSGKKINDLRYQIYKIKLPDACSECGAMPGQLHNHFFCKYEICPICGEGHNGCECFEREMGIPNDREPTDDEWAQWYLKIKAFRKLWRGRVVES